MIKYNLIKENSINPIKINNNVKIGGIDSPTQKIFINKNYNRDDLISAFSYALMKGQKYYIGVDPCM